VHRVSAILTTLIFLNATIYGFGWYCVPVPGKCSAVDAMDGKACEVAPKVSCSCTSPCERIAKTIPEEASCGSTCGQPLKSRRGAGCGSSEEGGCTTRAEAPERTECQSARSEEFPTLSRTCEMPDNTWCLGKPMLPKGCTPVRCILMHPILGNLPPKAASSVIPTAVESPNQQLPPWSVPRAGPTLPQIWGVSPIIETTVLRI
jgi:hypothetical protein